VKSPTDTKDFTQSIWQGNSPSVASTNGGTASGTIVGNSISTVTLLHVGNMLRGYSYYSKTPNRKE
jgi:hypothetical protein